MPPQIHELATRRASAGSDDSSELSSVPSDINDTIVIIGYEPTQAPTRQEHHKQKAGVEFAGPEANTPKVYEIENSQSSNRKRGLRVQDIESELRLTAEQGRALHNLIRDEMKEVHILGKINFSAIDDSVHEHITRIIETAKYGLKFLKEKGVEEKRLDELLRARMIIVNSNEKHNDMMVKTGRVHARAGASHRAPGNTEGAKKEVDNARVEADQASVAKGTGHDRRSTQRPSSVAATIADLNTEEQQTMAPQEDMVAIPSPRENGTSSIFSFHPLAFLVRIANSTIGAAIRSSQLVPASCRDSITQIDDFSYELFLENVTNQVGFDVRNRISAVVPKSIGCGYATEDVTVRLVSDEEWRAMLQLWQNARRKTCEFVVDGPASKE